MAAVTQSLFSADANLARASYTHDDVSLLISTVTLVNDSPQPFYAELRRVSDSGLLWSGNVLPTGQTANPPFTLAPGVYDITVQNLHLTPLTVSIYARWPA